MRATPLLVTMLAMLAGAAEPVSLVARTLESAGVRVEFPAVTYRSPPSTSGDPLAACAGIASDALGATVDPARDEIAVTEHRVVLRDPTDRGRLLKIYRPDHYDAERIAKYLQRDLGFEQYLRGLGLRVAAIDRNPRLVERGVLRQERVDGSSLDKLYPYGYQAGANPSVDRMLAAIASVDDDLRRVTSKQSGLLLSNTVDCHHEVPLGVDVGHCRGNIFVERGTGEAVLIDW
jgi:hypothetical protein